MKEQKVCIVSFIPTPKERFVIFVLASIGGYRVIKFSKAFWKEFKKNFDERKKKYETTASNEQN